MEMANKTGEILCFVFVAIGLGFWVTAMALPGWFLFYITLNSSSIQKLFPGMTGILTSSTKISLREEWGIFHIKTCIADICKTFPTHLLSSLNTGESLHLPSPVEMKIESLLTAILVAACCVLLIPYKFTPKRCLFAIIILLIAGIPSGTLIIRTAESNANTASALKILQLLLGKDNIGMDLPYSLLLGAAGILFASFSWMYCIVLFFKLRKIASQAKARRVQNVSSVQGIPLEHIYTTLQRPYYLDAV